MGRDVESQPVINIAGRDYAVLPLVSENALSKQLVEFVKRHPKRDDVNWELEQCAERLLQEVLTYLRDAIAVTAVECGEDEDYVGYKLYLPVLMPLDTRKRWKYDGELEELEKYNRRMKEAAERQETGKPYVFKVLNELRF